MDDIERFQRNLMKACVTFDRKPDAMLIDVWWTACKSVSDTQFEQAMDDLLMEITRFPTPAQLRARVYQLHEERAEGAAVGSPFPGVPLLLAGEAVSIAKREGMKYATNPIATPLFSCLVCRDRTAVRIETMVGMPHFGAAIPCPHCRGDRYDAYVEKHGIPPTMPKWAEG
jgi:hypothetical protein